MSEIVDTCEFCAKKGCTLILLGIFFVCTDCFRAVGEHKVDAP